MTNNCLRETETVHSCQVRRIPQPPSTEGRSEAKVRGISETAPSRALQICRLQRSSSNSVLVQDPRETWRHLEFGVQPPSWGTVHSGSRTLERRFGNSASCCESHTSGFPVRGRRKLRVWCVCVFNESQEDWQNIQRHIHTVLTAQILVGEVMRFSRL